MLLLLLLLSSVYSYSPTSCTVTNYDFTFIYDKENEIYKIHGLWPEICAECPECNYPSCCNIENVVYEYPEDPTGFIDDNWYKTLSREECNNLGEVILFEHEYYKHISCTNLKTTDEFLKLVIFLYNNYYDKYVANNCVGYNQLWLNLDENYNYNSTKCL
jgi:hypothetical protein